MAALIRITQARATEKFNFCTANHVQPHMHEQILYSFQHDQTIEVYLKGSDMPFEGIVYRIDDFSFVLLETSGKLVWILKDEIQALRWQVEPTEQEEQSIYEQASAGFVKNP